MSGLDLASAQGDRAIMACAAAFGARVGRSGNVATTIPDALRGRTIDVRDTPDLVPPLAAIAANATGTTVIANAGRLRLKESDRLKTVLAALTAMGASIEEKPDALVIHGKGPLSGGTVDAANDHRIAMMAAIAGANATGPTTIRGAECVAKSYTLLRGLPRPRRHLQRKARDALELWTDAPCHRVWTISLPRHRLRCRGPALRHRCLTRTPLLPSWHVARPARAAGPRPAARRTAPTS